MIVLSGDEGYFAFDDSGEGICVGLRLAALEPDDHRVGGVAAPNADELLLSAQRDVTGFVDAFLPVRWRENQLASRMEAEMVSNENG